MGTAWVLMYHNVAPDVSNPWCIPPEELRRHMQYLHDHDYKVGNLESVLQEDDSAVITFDDGYVSVLRHALPILASFGYTATVFVPTSFVGGLNAYDCVFAPSSCRPARIMSWPQLGELQAAGWSIQSHGCSHIPLRSLLGEYIEDEVRRSKLVIEDRLGAEVFAYAYAYGALPSAAQARDVVELFAANGYRAAFLAGGGATATPPPQRYRVSRVAITGKGYRNSLERVLADGRGRAQGA